MAEPGLVLTEAQVVALERKKEKQEATGEIETEHPGYLVAQVTWWLRIPITLVTAKRSTAFTSRLSSTPTAGWPLPNATLVSTPLSPQKRSMTR